MCKAMRFSEGVEQTMKISGFGSDKYVEVNRIMATRAREYGGCMVARSQMHSIVEQDPMLDRTVEQKYYIYCLQIFICGDPVLSHHLYLSCSRYSKTFELAKYQKKKKNWMQFFLYLGLCKSFESNIKGKISSLGKVAYKHMQSFIRSHQLIMLQIFIDGQKSRNF